LNIPAIFRADDSTRNPEKKFTITTPSFRPIFRSRSSGTFRGCGASARQLECDAMIGAFDSASTSSIVPSDTCDTSTSIPSRFISVTTASPSFDSPPCFGSSVALSAISFVSECVSVMYRTPSCRSSRSTASEPSIECPPSAPIKHAILPEPWIRSTSAAVSASSSVSG
jgi:hypothetical protein